MIQIANLWFRLRVGDCVLGTACWEVRGHKREQIVQEMVHFSSKRKKNA